MATEHHERLATDVSDAMRRIARVLKAHAPDYGAVIAQRIHERMPEFGDRKVTQLTRDAVAAAVAGFARMVLREETPDQLVVPAESLEYVRAFVHRNIDVELLVREYRLGHEELWRVCGQLVAEEPLEADARATLSEVLSETIFGYIDVLSGRTLEEYRAERARWAPSAEKRRYDTIATILAGEPVDAEKASQILHYPLEVSHVALVLWVGGRSRDVRPDTLLRAAAQELASLAACNSSLVVCASRLVAWAWLGFRDHPDESRMTALLEPRWRPDGVSIAVGEPAAGISGFRRSHADALGTRRLAKVSASRPGAVMRWGNVAILGLLSADYEHARQFVSRELGALDADDDAAARLRATVATYFREGDVIASTAQRLGIHINTVGYRLRQCEELLEHPVKERRFELEAALRLRDQLGISQAVDSPAGT